MAMRLFVCEYVTGGGFAGAALPAGLRQEGEAMLRALVGDLARLEGLDLLVARDARLPSADLPGTPVPVEEGDDCWRVWTEAIDNADAVWPVAPETGGLLLRLCALTVAAGKALLGCRPEAVRLCGSKRATFARLSAHAIPVVPTWRLGGDEAPDPPAPAGWVAKPDDGAGAEDTFFLPDEAALIAFRAAPPAGHDWVVQPFLPGEAASLSLLCRDGEAWLLSCNDQHVDLTGGRFHYRGWTVGGREAQRDRYAPLAAAVARAIAGLWGYVGVDLIDTAAGPVVLEINPRLTTPYAGLGDAIGANPAALVLALAAGERPPSIRATRPRTLRLEPCSRPS
jgi:predicted ATP-grasp superfamily ATP-dependent carboligase